MLLCRAELVVVRTAVSVAVVMQNLHGRIVVLETVLTSGQWYNIYVDSYDSCNIPINEVKDFD